MSQYDGVFGGWADEDRARRVGVWGAQKEHTTRVRRVEVSEPVLAPCGGHTKTPLDDCDQCRIAELEQLVERLQSDLSDREKEARGADVLLDLQGSSLRQQVEALKNAVLALDLHRNVPCSGDTRCDLADCGMVSHNHIIFKTGAARDAYANLVELVEPSTAGEPDNG